MDIKYRYSYTINKEDIVDINTLDRQSIYNSNIFKCLGCDNVLIPVLGDIRQKHFRHKVNINCSSETYLHKLAKTTFYQVYKDCLDKGKPYCISFEQTRICNHYNKDYLVNCLYNETEQSFDLTHYFSKIYLEEKQASFIPDLLLTNEKGDKLFVEIAVTHKIEQSKVNSGHRIIEFDIASEDDINIIKSTNSKQSEKVRFFNFRHKLIGDFCKGKCTKDTIYSYFVIYNNGKGAILEGSVKQINILRESKKFKYVKYVETIGFYEYVKLIVEAYRNKRGIKNCFLCRFHTINDYWNEPIYCKFRKINCDYDEAARCKCYRPDRAVFPLL